MDLRAARLQIRSYSLCGVSTSAALFVFASLASCAPSRYEGFAPVGRTVKSRTGYTVIWSERAMDNSAYAAQIHELLASDLTADGAVRIALLNNHDLQASFESIGIGLAAVAEATVLENPELDAELRIPLDGDGKSIQLSAQQDLMSLITLSQRRDAANADLGAARSDAAAAVIDLVSDVRHAFYGAKAAAQIVDLRQTVLDSLEAGYDLSLRLYEAGNITDLALAQERALLGEGKLELANAETGSTATRERLNALLGLSGTDTGWKIGDQLPSPPTDVGRNAGELEAVAIKASLQLERERWHMHAAAGRIGVARISAWLPRLSAGASFEREFDGSWSVGPAATLSIPLFDRKQGDRQRGHAQLRAAQHRYVAIAVRVRAQVRAAHAEVAAARARFFYISDELMPVRATVLEQTLLQYNSMSATTFELLQAKREQISTAVLYVEALRDYWKAHAVLEQLTSGSAPGIPMPMENGQ